MLQQRHLSVRLAEDDFFLIWQNDLNGSEAQY